MIYEFLDYRKFVQAKIAENKRIRGYQTILAKAAGCHRTFLSQVLRSHVQMTPDQAAKLASYWELDDDESKYFIDLVNLERSSSKELRRILKSKLDAARERDEDLTKRFRQPDSLPKQLESYYYSSWIPSAVHMIVGIPRFKTASAIAQHLELPQKLVTSTLRELEKMGFVSFASNKWSRTKKSVHLPRYSQMNSTHHNNWRGRAVINSSQASTGLHYTAIHTMSKADARRLKNLLLKAIDNVRTIVEPSGEEELVCFNLDFYGV